VLQVALAVLFLLMLDGGRMFWVYRCAWVAQLIGTAIIVLRRHRAPTGADLAAIRYGIFVMLAAAMIFRAFIRPDF
jgi:hypothetical protein